MPLHQLGLHPSYRGRVVLAGVWKCTGIRIGQDEMRKTTFVFAPDVVTVWKTEEVMGKRLDSSNGFVCSWRTFEGCMKRNFDQLSRKVHRCFHENRVIHDPFGNNSGRLIEDSPHNCDLEGDNLVPRGWNNWFNMAPAPPTKGGLNLSRAPPGLRFPRVFVIVNVVSIGKG
jgi:hypothetical protein